MNQERLMKVIVAPHVSEKSTFVGDRYQQYVFRVVKDATKPEIKRAVELMFNVKVDAVRVCNTKSKAKRYGRFEGRRGGWKKAYISLEAGQKIDFGIPQA